MKQSDLFEAVTAQARAPRQEMKAATTHAEMAILFDKLKPKQRIAVAMTSVMGSGQATDGKPHDWLVGRRSKSKKYNTETIVLMPVDGSWKPNKYNAYKLYKRTRHGEVTVSAAHGDMGLFLKSISVKG